MKSQEWGKNCKIVTCLEAKGLDFCYECGEYPECEKFRLIADSCLKHGENLMENLNKIKAGKIEEWHEKRTRNGDAQKCCKPIAMHLTECHRCGAKSHA